MKLARIILLLLVIVGVGLHPRGVHADEEGDTSEPALTAEQQKAKELKKQGDEAMFDLRYDDALEHYEEAYELEPKPALLYNQARAHQARGSYPEALALLNRFDAEAPDELKARVPRLAELIADVKSKVSALTVNSNVDGATVMVRNVDFGKSPFAEPLSVIAGKADVTLSAPGHLPQTKSVTLPGGGALELTFTLKTVVGATVLAVGSPVVGATVFVDGKRIGVVPAEVQVAPGKHSVLVTHDDYEDATTSAVVKPGARTRVNLDLVELPAIYEQWWLWTGIAVVAAGVTVGVIAAVTEGPIQEGSIPPGTVQAPIISW